MIPALSPNFGERRDGVTPDRSRNRKGSTWVLSLANGRLVAADHLASPLADVPRS
jgi:8-oxo-dGTP diphosphatase